MSNRIPNDALGEVRRLKTKKRWLLATCAIAIQPFERFDGTKKEKQIICEDLNKTQTHTANTKVKSMLP